MTILPEWKAHVFSILSVLSKDKMVIFILKPPKPFPPSSPLCLSFFLLSPKIPISHLDYALGLGFHKIRGNFEEN